MPDFLRHLSYPTGAPPASRRVKASRSIASTASAKICGGASRPSSGADWEVVKAAIGDYLADEETWPGREVERALWFVFAVAKSRGAKARWRRPTNGPPFVADRYFQSVRFDEGFI